MPRHRLTAERRKFAKHLRSNQTSLEDLLWRELRAKRLDGWKFKRQVPIDDVIVDFVLLRSTIDRRSGSGRRRGAGARRCG